MNEMETALDADSVTLAKQGEQWVADGIREENFFGAASFAQQRFRRVWKKIEAEREEITRRDKTERDTFESRRTVIAHRLNSLKHMAHGMRHDIELAQDPELYTSAWKSLEDGFAELRKRLQEL